MTRINNLYELKMDLEKNARHCAGIAALWHNVEYKTKKDGTDFAVLKNAFKNCTIKKDYRNESEISIYGHEYIKEYGGYINFEDYITTFKDAREMPEADPTRIIKDGFHVPFIRLTPAEISEEIKKRAEYWENEANECARELARLEATYDAVSAKYKELVEIIKGNTEKNSHAYYMLCKMFSDKLEFGRE